MPPLPTPNSNEESEANENYLHQFPRTLGQLVRREPAGAGFEKPAGAPQWNEASPGGSGRAGAAATPPGGGFGDSDTYRMVPINSAVAVPEQLLRGAVPVTVLKNGLAVDAHRVEAF